MAGTEKKLEIISVINIEYRWATFLFNNFYNFMT